MFQEYYKSKAKYYSDEIQRFNEKNLGKLNDFNDAVKKYVINNFLYDYVAFYIATYYKMDAMWECKMEQEVNSALCSLCNFEGTELDYEKIKHILRTKHQINITNEIPLEIEEL